MSTHPPSPFVSAISELRRIFPDADVSFLSYPNHPARETLFLFSLDFGEPKPYQATVVVTQRDVANARNDRELTSWLGLKVDQAILSLREQTGRVTVQG